MALKKQKGSPRGEAGQVLLIVILVIIVASTIGLSLASRSVISLRTSTEEAESQKALAAAEAGIERMIQGDISVAASLHGDNPSNNSKYDVGYVEVKGDNFLMSGGNSLPKDEGADLWLSTYSSNPSSNYTGQWSGNLSIYWGEDTATPCNNSALEIIIISGSTSSPALTRYAYDPCEDRRNTNKFSSPSSGTIIDAKTFLYGVNINNISSGLIARIIPIYGNASVGVKSNPALPLQGYKIDSTGTSGQASRKLTVFKGHPEAYLPYLSYGLFVAK